VTGSEKGRRFWRSYLLKGGVRIKQGERLESGWGMEREGRFARLRIGEVLRKYLGREGINVGGGSTERRYQTTSLIQTVGRGGEGRWDRLIGNYGI